MSFKNRYWHHCLNGIHSYSHMCAHRHMHTCILAEFIQLRGRYFTCMQWKCNTNPHQCWVISMRTHTSAQLDLHTSGTWADHCTTHAAAHLEGYLLKWCAMLQAVTGASVSDRPHWWEENHSTSRNSFQLMHMTTSLCLDCTCAHTCWERGLVYKPVT